MSNESIKLRTTSDNGLTPILNYYDSPKIKVPFNFKLKIIGKNAANNNDGNIAGRVDVEIMVPLKYLSIFSRTLEMPLINFEIQRIADWSKNCVLIYTNLDDQVTTFTITETNLYDHIVTLSTQDNAKLLPQLRLGFKRAISWNKCLAKPELLAQNPNLTHLIEPSFQGVNSLFVLAFKNDDQRISNKRYYIPNVEIKDCNVMVDGQIFFDQLINNIIKTYENIRKVSIDQRDASTTGCLLDYTYFKRYYKIIAIGLTKQQSLDADPTAIQQISFSFNLDRAGKTRFHLIVEEANETVFEFSQGTVKVLWTKLNTKYILIFISIKWHSTVV